MNKIVVLAMVLATSVLAQNTLEHDCFVSGVPDSSCIMDGFVCNLGFGVAEEKSVLFFNIGKNASCDTLVESVSLPTYLDSTNQSIPSPQTKFFLIEDEYNAGPLSLTLAGSLAMSASLNGRKVSVIYRRVNLKEYGGIRLLSIQFFD